MTTTRTWKTIEAGMKTSGSFWAYREADGWRLTFRNVMIENRIQTVADVARLAEAFEWDRSNAAELARESRANVQNRIVRLTIAESLKAAGWRS